VPGVFSCLVPRPPPTSTLFPYTTLFRSVDADDQQKRQAEGRSRIPQRTTAFGPCRGRHRRVALSDREPVGEDHHQQAVDEARHRSEEHTSELQSRENLVCRLLLEKKKHK